MPARPAISSISRELLHRGDQARPVELGDLAGVACGERVGAGLGVGEQRVDAGLRIIPGAVQEVGEVPRDLLQLGVADGLRGGHAPKC